MQPMDDQSSPNLYPPSIPLPGSDSAANGGQFGQKQQQQKKQPSIDIIHDETALLANANGSESDASTNVPVRQSVGGRCVMCIAVVILYTPLYLFVKAMIVSV